MAIKLISVKKISEINHGDLGNPGDFYKENTFKKLGKIFIDSFEEMKSLEAEREKMTEKVNEKDLSDLGIKGGAL